MTFISFLLWWVSIGGLFAMSYLFLYHKGIDAWIDYQVYLEAHDEDDEDKHFTDIKELGNPAFAALVVVVFSAIFPILPLLFIVHDELNDPAKKY